MQSPVLESLLKQNVTGMPVKDFLQQVVTAHPYFAPAHFFLMQQLQQTESGFNGQAAATALLFNNPYWLNFQLQQAAAKEAPVITMYAAKETATTAAVEPVAVLQADVAKPLYIENTDNDDDNAVLVSKESSAIIAAADTVEVQQPVEATEISEPEIETSADLEMPDIKIYLSASIKGAENLNAPAFEPMHLVDYFASQGIKLSEEVQSGDKLGRQLKSFTEWLKTMKKVHVADTAVSGGEVAVQAMAEKSNAENEVLTEAMAEVFAQQGKAAKAIEVYEKLSLLNTAKSAYFAAKIQNLKGE